MESQPQNPKFRNNPENFHQCIIMQSVCDKTDKLTLHADSKDSDPWVKLHNSPNPELYDL